MRGTWIVITGLDGTGKTTLKRDLEHYLNGQNFNCKDFHLPYDKNLLDLMNNVIGEGLPLKDNYSDQLLFTLDNRIVGTVLVKSWRQSYDYLISQRGFIDSFVHGQCRGFSYAETESLMRTYDLDRCQVMIHLNADPNIAFDRIKNDPEGDKFETLQYIKKQSAETKAAYDALQDQHPDLSSFKGIPNIYVDTSEISTSQTFELVKNKLKELNIIE